MRKDSWIAFLFRVVAYLVFLSVVLLFAMFFIDGARYFSWEFFSQVPRQGMEQGGILPAILGTLIILLFSLLLAIPVGILTGVYLSEYAGDSKLGTFLNVSITALGGVPSIVFGLFGLSLFCITMGLGTSILAGSLTLSLMTLPVISSAVKEALAAVPVALRESGYALGARKTEVIFRILLPFSRARIITACLIGGGRVMGETAPVLLTGAVFYATQYPSGLGDPVMTLPSHIYYITMAYGKDAQWMAKGTSAFLLLLVLAIYLVAFRFRRKNHAR